MKCVHLYQPCNHNKNILIATVLNKSNFSLTFTDILSTLLNAKQNTIEHMLQYNFDVVHQVHHAPSPMTGVDVLIKSSSFLCCWLSVVDLCDFTMQCHKQEPIPKSFELNHSDVKLSKKWNDETARIYNNACAFVCVR